MRDLDLSRAGDFLRACSATIYVLQEVASLFSSVQNALWLRVGEKTIQGYMKGLTADIETTAQLLTFYMT